MTAIAPTADHPIVRAIAPTEVAPAGTHVVVEPDAATRAALATLADVLSVDSLRAELVVRPWSGAGFSVEGRVRAELRQACVVTLEPVVTLVDEPVSLKLVPPEEMPKYLETPDEDGAIDIDVARDLPEPFEGGAIDIGAIVVEHLMVGVDPYPRKPGVVFDAAAAGVEGGPEVLSPFAALARLGKE